MGYVKDELMYNTEGYFDPTAGFALKNVLKKEPKFCGYVSWAGQPIYICHTWEIKTDADIDRIGDCCRFAERQGAQPLSPMLFYSGIVDVTDENEQRKVLHWTRSWIKHASEIWIFDGVPPRSLKADIVHRIRKGKTVRFFKSDNGGYKLVKEIVPGTGKTDDENKGTPQRNYEVQKTHEPQ